MNQHVMVALLTFVTGSLALPALESGRHEPNGRFIFGDLMQKFMCKKAVTPSLMEYLELKKAKAYCTFAQLFLMDRIDDIKVRTSEEGRNIGGGNFKDMTPPGRGEDADFALILETRGTEEDAYFFNYCVADKMDMVDVAENSSYSDTYDMIKLNGWISSNVDGLSIESIIGDGMDSCGPVVDFDVNAYLDCVKAYCVNGGGPETLGGGEFEGPPSIIEKFAHE